MNTFKCYEMFVECMGWNFHVIFGEHSNGKFIAIPNFDVCIEASDYGDVFYNKESLSRCNNPCVADCAREIAVAIRDSFIT